jgi:CRP-like cAMP-binding protein
MTKITDLFRRNASDTSVEAALSIEVSQLERMVLNAIKSAGDKGMTQQELIEKFSNYSYSSITARPSALKRKGLIIDSGERRVGKSGRKQAVLVASEFVA